MGNKNSKTNIVDVTNNITQQVYNNLKNNLDVEAQINVNSKQKITIKTPAQCQVNAANITKTKGKIIQTASIQTLNAIADALNSNLDSNVDQLNQDGADAVFGWFGKAQDDFNSITTSNILKNELHNNITNAVRANSEINVEVLQEIDLDQTSSRLPQNVSCGGAFLRNINCTEAQIGQIATSIVDNVAGIETISDDTLEAVQTDTGFLGDAISAFATIFEKVMYVIIVVAIIGLVITAGGGLLYFTTRPSHPRSSDSLIDGIQNSLINS